MELIEAQIREKETRPKQMACFQILQTGAVIVMYAFVTAAPFNSNQGLCCWQ